MALDGKAAAGATPVILLRDPVREEDGGVPSGRDVCRREPPDVTLCSDFPCDGP